MTFHLYSVDWELCPRRGAASVIVDMFHLYPMDWELKFLIIHSTFAI